MMQRRSIRCALTAPVLSLFWGLMLALTLAAADDTRPVLVVNSKMGVPTYETAQQSFIESLPGRAVALDLAGARSPERLLAEALRKHNPRLVYCIGSQAYEVAATQSENRPLVLSSAINLQRLGAVGRTFGVVSELPVGMQLTMFRMFFPKVKRVGVLYSPKFFTKAWISEAKAQARDSGIEIEARSLRRPQDLERRLADILPTVDALWLVPDPVVLSGEAAVRTIFAGANAAGKPVFAYSAAFADQGAALAIEADVATIGRQAARIAQDVLAGEEIAARFQDPAGSEITINLQVVHQLGLTFNEDLLSMVNRIIK